MHEKISLNSLPFIMLIFNKGSSYFQKVNSAASKLLGYTEEEFKNMTLADVVEGEEYNSIEEIHQILLMQNELSFDTTFKTRSGQIIPFEIEAFLYGEDKGNEKIVLAGKSITRIKILEDEIDRLKNRVKESIKLKTEFINNVSHEIRTPMNGIIGFADLLKNPGITPETRNKYIEIINQSAMQLLGIVDNIIDISSLEKKEQTLNRENVNINTLLERIFREHRHLVGKESIDFKIELPPDNKEITVFTDRDKLYTILNNLVDNAIKFTSEGSITFGRTLEEGSISFYVTDTGIGIAPDNREVIFESFSQEDKRYSRQYGGLGVGLTIAKKYAELLGGKISFTSKKGKGSTFICSIPYNSGESLTEETGYKPDSDVKDKVMAGKIVLIVEDEGINLLYLQALLKRYAPSINILKAKNGREAVDTVLEKEKINLILMDLKMPVMDGFEALEKIKRIKPDLPVVAQSAYSSRDDIVHAKESGCADYITKPIQEKKLFEILDKYL